MRLKEVYKVYQKWLNVTDTRRIDSGLAVALTREIKGTKLWVIYVGHSGDWKSEQINALDNGLHTKVIKGFTSRTLVNGDPKVPDLAPQLKDKIVLIPEMAQILKLMPADKAQVWAQLRDLYDGVAGKQSGLGLDVLYKDLNITLIAGATPAIDSQILIHQDLGSRELLWRTNGEKDAMEDDKTMDMCWNNEEAEGNMRLEIKKATQDFLSDNKYNPKIKISEEIKERLKVYCIYLSYLRSPAEIDSYTGELLNDAHPEKPTRILKQLKRLFIALKSLDEDYEDDRAIAVIEHFIKSSCFQNRLKIFEYLLPLSEEETLTHIASVLSIGKKTVYRELNTLWNLNIIKRRTEEYDNFGKEGERYYWIINKKHELVRKLLESD